MKSIASALFTLTLASAPALAALPPHYQRQAEFVAALNVAVETLGIANPVDAITLTEADRFEIRAGSCSLIVNIVSEEEKRPEGLVGPRMFRAEAEEPICE